MFRAGVTASTSLMRAFAFLGAHTQEAKFVVAPRVSVPHTYIRIQQARQQSAESALPP